MSERARTHRRARFAGVETQLSEADAAAMLANDDDEARPDQPESGSNDDRLRQDKPPHWG